MPLRRRIALHALRGEVAEQPLAASTDDVVQRLIADGIDDDRTAALVTCKAGGCERWTSRGRAPVAPARERERAELGFGG